MGGGRGCAGPCSRTSQTACGISRNCDAAHHAGTVGLQVLRGVNERTEQLIGLQRKIEAYRQVQHDTISQLYSVSSALLSSDEPTLSSTLRQLNQFGYDVDRLHFVAKDEVELLGQF